MASPAWRRRTSRRRMWRLVTGSYGIDVVLVAMFAVAGTVSWKVPVVLGASVALVSSVFYALLTRPANTTIGDPYLTVPQMAVASAAQLVALALVPQLAPLFLNVLFVVFAFGALRLTARQALAGCAIVAVALSLVLSRVWTRIELPHRTPFEVALVCALYVLTLARCMYVGLQGSWLLDQLRRSNDQLASFSERIDRMAHHDELTGVMNRRAIRSLLEDHAALAARGLDTLFVALLDVDSFKSINDRFGHAVGDDVLREFAAILTRTKRVTDFFGRYGGEEFLFLLSCPSTADAHDAMERIRMAIATRDWGELSEGLTVTTSIGIAEFHPAQSVADLIRQADVALYEAKRQGRDRVVLVA